MLPFRPDLLCNGQAFRATYFLRHSCCPVAYKSGIIDLSVQTDAVGNDMDMPVVGIFMRYCYLLVVVKSHLVGKQMGYLHEFRNGQLFLILWCYTDFDAEELVSASCVVIADHLHFLVNFFGVVPQRL